MYDTIIIGGGISGIFCAMNLKNSLLLEANDYLGGRILTHKSPQYEIGAGRYNEYHTHIVSLIKQFKLTPFPLNNKGYLMDCEAIIPDIDTYFNSKIKKVFMNGSRDELFYNHCLKYLSKKDTDELVSIFGFVSEFKEMNAYDAIKLFKKKEGKYFAIKEGLSELIKRMSTNINHKLNHKVANISVKDGIFSVDQYLTKKIIFAIPPDNLKKIKILEPIFPLLNSVHTNCLLRIYASYPTHWYKDLPSLTINSFIRHIIPINSKIIMISYVEGFDAQPYLTKSGNLRQNNINLSKIQKEIRRLFPHHQIPEPTAFHPYLWKIGDHAWKPGYNSDTISKKILNPLPNIYICGEAFSHTQSWIEGALETATQVLDILERVHK